MDASVVGTLCYLDLSFSIGTLFFLFRSAAGRKFAYLTALLSLRVCSSLIYVVLRTLSHQGIVSSLLAYRLYFFTYWAAYAGEAILSLLVVYSIFHLAMAPLKGLQTLGMLVFRWAGAISVALAVGFGVGPHATGKDFFLAATAQLQQTSSVLTLCLLLFVCFAIRPMGLSFKSRIFGISFGLGLMAATDLVGAAWLSRGSNIHSLGSVVNMLDSVVGLVTLLMWSVYFALPEPKRRIIVLPTTSPFLRWNQISMALGDEPGFVAIGGIPPEVFAPAEIEVMRRASVKMTENEALRTQVAETPFHSLTA